MKKLLVLLCMSCALIANSQTHLTLNKEECWIVKSGTALWMENDKPAYTGVYYIAVILEDSVQKPVIEKILKTQSAEDAEYTLLNLGYRIEIFRESDLVKIKRNNDGKFRTSATNKKKGE